MRLAGAGVADEEHVLAPLDVLTASQLAEQQLVDRGPGAKVEALQRLVGRQVRRLETSLGGLAFALQQLELGELQQVG